MIRKWPAGSVAPADATAYELALHMTLHGSVFTIERPAGSSTVDHAFYDNGWGNCAYCPDDGAQVLPHPPRTHDILGRSLLDSD